MSCQEKREKKISTPYSCAVGAIKDALKANLRALLVGKKQTAIAAKMDELGHPITQQYISALMKNKDANPTLDVLEVLAQALNADPFDLVRPPGDFSEQPVLTAEQRKILEHLRNPKMFAYYLQLYTLLTLPPDDDIRKFLKESLKQISQNAAWKAQFGDREVGVEPPRRGQGKKKRKSAG